MRFFEVFELRGDIEPRASIVHAECSWCTQMDEVRQAETLSRFQSNQLPNAVRASRATIDEDTVAAFWVANDFFEEKDLGLRIQLDVNQLWLFGAMVAMQHRGAGVFPQLLKFTCEELSKSGGAQQFAAVNPLNRPSRAMFRRYSKTVCGSALVFRLLNFNWSWAGGKCVVDRTFSLNCKEKPIQLKILN